MAKTSIEEKAEKNYDAIVLHYTGADSSIVLNEEQQRMLDRWRTAHAILRKYPRKHIAAKMLQSRYPGLSIQHALVDVNQAARLWNITDKVDRDFIEGWFIDKILAEITRKDSTPQAIAQNLKTLKDYILAMPQVQADPRLMEKNDIKVVFNVGSQNVQFSEEELTKMPTQLRERILSSMNSTIGEEQAAQIIES